MTRAVSAQRLVLASILAALPAALASAAAQAQSAGASAMVVAGWVENAWIGEPPIMVKVKLDTGARNSSINAPAYREFERDGKSYVSFVLTNNEGKEANVERPVVREARIRRAGAERQERPVITLKVCIAGKTSEVEFTLADRSEMNYPILIGRSFLAERILVDSGRTFVAPGGCPSG